MSDKRRRDVNRENTGVQTEAPETIPPTARDAIYAILGAAAEALGIVLYVLAVFTPVAIYGLIGGIACEIAACGLFKTQKKRRPVAWAKAVYIVCCVVLALGVAFMIGGIIWASQQG